MDVVDGTEWLIDKSALVRLARSADAAAWSQRIERGLVRIATVTLLEVGYSARSADELRRGIREPPVGAMPIEYATPAAEDRAVEVLTRLADSGHHRAPSIPDLLIAALAEHAGLTVLHDDKDFELIAEITGQPVMRLSAWRLRTAEIEKLGAAHPEQAAALSMQGSVRGILGRLERELAG